MRYSLIFLAFLCFGIKGVAQELDHVLGNILIQIEDGQTPQRLLGELSFYEGEISEISGEQIVREPMNIWLLSFNQNAINEFNLLHSIKIRRDVITAQFNHVIKPRLEPNDPDYGLQWQYNNDGSSGVVDADMDMDQAWDIATGGMTVNGDQIVACVIDDGLDGSHMDFQDNLWTNEAEIPGNNVDDDGNGFVDDVNGWDSYVNDDSVFDGGGHGTPVAGIVGAKGNNDIGVAGVNWNVKLMIVQGGGNEAEALAAYSYPYWFRKRYNETDGAEGAFVVTTNASWGVDFGQPEDAPLWCSFYDSLGMVGILNCGATINGNQNVDEIGDLPTACDSEFLLSVTNMNSFDEKVTFAGYGATTIDLGAHGDNAYTTSFGNFYSGFGGTSGATPHVTGTIALAYSVECSELADMAISDPAEAAKIVRDFILYGVDPNTSLEGITVTGGRLNAFNSLLMVQNFCSDCPPPFGINVSAITDTMATISWEVPDSSTSTTIRYRVEGTEEWDTIPDVSSPLSLTTLLACTEYELEALSVCKDTMSDFGSTFMFKTDGCCEIPEDISFSVTDTNVIVLWNSKIAAESYSFEYKSVDSTEWIAFETADTSIVIDELLDCNEYEARLIMNCKSGETIESDIYTFIAGCGVCTSKEYCSGFDLFPFGPFIDSFYLGEQFYASGDDDGYADFSGQVDFNVRQDAAFDVRIVHQYGAFEVPVAFSVWIDYNQNLEFEEEELAFTSEIPEFTPVSGVIEIPQEALVGYTKMRVAMRGMDFPTPCPDPEFVGGEVEDYCIWIGEEVFPCDLGFEVMIEDISKTGAMLFWTPLDSAIAYNVRYKALTEEFNYFAVLDTFYEVMMLDECTDYIAEVRAVCAHDTSTYNTVMFKTECSTSTNDPIAGLSDLNVYPNPFQSEVTLDFLLDDSKDIHVELVDLSGRRIFTQEHRSLSSGTNTIHLSGLNDISAGVYLLRLSSEGKQMIRKLVKSNFY